jgi:PIN domain nuclease of toxin-antitoxin system
VKFLIDTHTLLWAYWGDPQMSATAIRLIFDPANRILVSPASHWEIAIKMKIGKLILREPFLDFVQHAVIDNGFAILPIEPKHTAIVATLPFHHKDPFDRLLIAQALAEGVPLVSADTVIDSYGVQRLW